MAIFKKPPEPPEDPPPPPPTPSSRPEWPPSIKCHLCSFHKQRGDPEIKWARRHCRIPCGWYACRCGGRMWIYWNEGLEAWVTKRSTVMK